MFSYQCRYCRVRFDQWEKLVIHRKEKHDRELEALKNQLLLSQPRFASLKGSLISMKPKRRSLPYSVNKARSVHTTPSRELDANDFDNNEISLHIPTNSGSIPRQSTSRTPPVSSTIVFPSTPFNSAVIKNGSGIDGAMWNGIPDSFVTPPITPSPTLDGELVLNGWETPFPKKPRYLQFDEGAEVEFSAVPSIGGSRVSLTRHSAPRSGIANGNHKDDDLNEDASNNQDEFLLRGTNQVIVDELNDELQIPCCKNGNIEVGTTRNFNLAQEYSHDRRSNNTDNYTNRSMPSGPLSTSGNPLERFHSQLQLQSYQSLKGQHGINSDLEISSTGRTSRINNNSGERNFNQSSDTNSDSPYHKLRYGNSATIARSLPRLETPNRRVSQRKTNSC